MPFGAKACLGATLHHFGSKSLFWSNPPSLLEQNLVLEQRSITFCPKASFGATLHNFLSKSLFWSTTPSLFKQKNNKDEVIWGPVRSGPVRPVRASWAQGTGADRTDRTGPDRAKLDLASARCRPCPVRSVRSAPVPWAQGTRTGQTGRTGPDRTDRMGQGRAGIFSSPLQLSNDM